MMTIGSLAEAGRVGIETIRYYQRHRLLAVPERPNGRGNSGAVRRYGADDLARPRFIRLAQAAGFTLDQIGELLQLDAGEDRLRARSLATAQIAALDKKIADLMAARTLLENLAQQCGATTSGPCPIILIVPDRR